MNRQFRYGPKWTVIVFCALFFGACAIVLGAKAKGNERGLILNGVIEFSPTGATIFYWVLAALSAGFVVVAGFLAVMRLALRQRIAFTETCLMVPRSKWSSEEVTVPFRDVLELTRAEASGQRFLTIVHPGGKFTLIGWMLPKKQDFDELWQGLSEGVNACRPHGRHPAANQEKGQPGR